MKKVFLKKWNSVTYIDALSDCCFKMKQYKPPGRLCTSIVVKLMFTEIRTRQGALEVDTIVYYKKNNV